MQIGLVPGTSTWRGHWRIARVDHWIKNLFVLPGIVVPLAWQLDHRPGLAGRIVLGLLACGLVASSNYTLNEIIDGPYDIHHPTKRTRPVPTGEVSASLALVQWLLLGAAGTGLAFAINKPFVVAMLALWVMGCAYNIPPVRTKDLPYLDVLSEAINNPIRMVAGWYIVTDAGFPPLSLLLGYWMIGCYLMAIKRFAELRHIDDRAAIARYRRSLSHITPERALVAIVFFAASAMLFLGAFIMRYRMELILTFPLVAWVMARFLALGFEPDSAAQHPEKLYRDAHLMVAVACTSVAMGVLLFVDVPLLHTFFAPGITPR